MSDRARYTRCARVAFGFVLVALALEPLLRSFLFSSTANEDFLLFQIQKARARDPADAAEVVFLGDSTLRSSVNPHTFAAQTGHAAMNLATVSNGGLMSDLYLLEEYLAAHPAPRMVVLVHALGVWQTDIHEHIYQTHFATVARTTKLLARGLITPLGAVDALLVSSLDSYRYRPYLRTLFDFLVELDTASLEGAQDRNARFRAARAELGWYPDARSFTPGEGAIPAGSCAQLEISRSGRYFFDALVALAEARGFRLVWGPSPAYAGYVEALRPCVEAEETMLRAQVAAHPSFSVLGIMQAFEARDLATFNHARPETAERISAGFADALRASLDSDRPSP